MQYMGHPLRHELKYLINYSEYHSLRSLLGSAMERDRNSALLQAVENLPDIYRETLLLYYYEEMKAEEIAKIQHTARSTVNVRLKRGRDMLREALRDESL